MTTDTLHAASSPAYASERWSASRFFRRLLREPLVHFIVLGATLFAINAVVAPDVPPERKIIVTPAVKQSIVDAFTTQRGHPPDPQELKRLLDDWVLDEITYREAIAQGFDKGDEMIRDRVMQKMRLLIFSNVSVPYPSETELQQWLDTHRDRYDVSARASFFEVPIGPSENEADTILALINAGKEPESVRLRAHTFVDRPVESLTGGFGEEFVDQLKALPIRKWQKLKSMSGWHIVRLDAVSPARKVRLEEVAGTVFEDWKVEQARAHAIETVRQMGKSYVIGSTEQ